MRTTRTRNMTRSSFLHLLSWSMLDSQERTSEETRLRNKLRSKGIAEDHVEGLRALDQDSCVAVIADFSNEKMRPRLLHALKILARSESTQVTKDAFDCIAKKLASVNTIPFDNQVRLIKSWQDNDLETEHLEDIVKWLSSSPLEFPKQGGWNAILRKRITQAQWSSPFVHGPQIGKIRVQTITNGVQLLKEGKTMGHCLADVEHAYEYALGCMDQTTQIFHLDIESNPLMCATLAIQARTGRSWKIAGFETVGRGVPPALLKEAAQKILEMVNDKFGYETEEDEDDEMLIDEDY